MLSYGNLQKAMKVDIAVSKKMADKILLWNNMYQNKAYWLNGEVKSLELPAAIAAEIARLVTMERQFGINGGKRAEYLSKQFCLVDTNLPIYVEYGCASGGEARLRKQSFQNSKSLEKSCTQGLNTMRFVERSILL